MSTIHVLPVNDLIEHYANGEDCPCGPTVEFVPPEDESQEDGWLITHHSLDGRELVEP
jgi:hypothetical protein